MPLKTIAYQSNSHSLQVWLKGPLGQGFGKGICQTIYNISLCYYHISSSHNVSNNMILSLYVLSFLVIPWIFGLCNRSIIVAKQCDGNLLHSHNTKIRKEFLEPNRFLYCLTSSNIFSFRVRVCNTRLLNTSLTYGSTSEGEHITWSGLSKIKIWLKIRICVTNRY